MADKSANKPGSARKPQGSGSTPARRAASGTGRAGAGKGGPAKGTSGRGGAGKGRPGKGQPGASKGRRPARRGGLLKRILGVGIVGLLALALVASIATLVFYNRTTLPDPNKDFTTNTSYVYYNDGKTQLGSFAVQNRQTIPYAQMPQNVKDAVVAAENRTFWTDRGISPSGIARSAWTIARGGEMQGGSTITQQYIKILYLSSDRTMTRKLRELALAVKMGKEVPKEQILEGYLNTIYFGRGAYGIQAAARTWFGVDAKNLTLSQAAVLASVLNSPSAFDPKNGKQATANLFARYQYVLDGMLEQKKITQAQHDAAHKALPAFPSIPLNQRWAGTNGYLLRMVENELLAKGFTQDQVDGGGLRITTTLDKTLEDKAIEVGQKYKKRVGANSSAGAKNLHPAIASVKVGTGEVLALYGGDDYLQNNRNWALTDRPAASTFKAWATVAGLRSGFSLNTILRGDSFTPNGDSVSINNDEDHEYGPVTLRKALQDSINTAFVDLTGRMGNGPAKIVKAANDAGIAKGAGWDLNGRIALGMAEVSPLDNAGGYATLANQGVAVANHVVASVKNAQGKVLFTGVTTGKQTIEKDVANTVTSALTNVVTSGTGTRAAIDYPVAGKTGTNGIKRDGKSIITSAWFVAYTRQISTAVMYVAGDDGNASLDDYRRDGDSAFFGGTYPALTWHDFMEQAMDGMDAEDFPYASSSDDSSDNSSSDNSSSDNSNDNSGQQSHAPVQAPSSRQPSNSPSAAPSSAPTPTGRPSATSRPTATSGSTATTRATSHPVQTSRAATQPTSNPTKVTTAAGGNPTGDTTAAAVPAATASR